MSSSRIDVTDDLIELALSAPDDVLGPGHNFDALNWVIEQKSQPTTLGSFAVLWTLSEQQRSLFNDELSKPTPTHYPAAEDHSVGRFGMLQLLISSSIGMPYGLPHQRNGVLLQDVFPKEGLFDRANSGLGATEAFDFHTDQAFSPDPLERPHHVTLACIRNNERAVTGIVALEDIIAELDTETIDQLTSSNFNVYTGRADEGKGEDSGSILVIDQNGTMTIRLGGDVEGITPDAKKALLKLKNVLGTNAHKEHMILKTGDILGFDNTRSIHFRSSFNPELSPDSRRWIRKAYIRSRAD